MEYTFRKADIQDFKEISILFKGATAKMIEEEILQWDEIYPNDEVLLQDIMQGEMYLLLTQDRRIAACFVVNEDQDIEYLKGSWIYNGDRIATLHRLCVHPDFQGKGVAKKAVQYMENIAKNSGYDCIRLDAFSKNLTALKLYKGSGYRYAGEIRLRKGIFHLMEKDLRFKVPQKVSQIIDELSRHGFEAYAVGGCVRDMVLGREPEDWDITTSATPQEVKKIFRRTVDTGIQHGTVTVLMDKDHFEVTTYRLDGIYEDSRHPKEVSFTSNLSEDLKRRDFTINAMAYNEKEGFIDLFGGMEDLKNGLIRCVGSAEERFGEDALRILRAVRFSAQLGFEIDEETMKAVRDKANNLVNISAERIRVELTKLLLSAHPDRLRTLYEAGITKIILPEFDAMMTTGQKNIHHIYTVGEHTIHAVSKVAGGQEAQGFDQKDRTILRWTMLLHDIEKPSTISIGKDGQNHFYGHQEKGAMTAETILRRLKFDNETITSIVHLIKWHDYRFVLTPAGMRKAMSKIGKDYMKLLFEVNRADTSAKNPLHADEKYERLQTARKLYQESIDKGECISLKELEVNGRDLLSMGLKPGKEFGLILNKLLAAVLEDPGLNKHETLMDMAKQMMKK